MLTRTSFLFLLSLIPFILLGQKTRKSSQKEKPTAIHTIQIGANYGYGARSDGTSQYASLELGLYRQMGVFRAGVHAQYIESISSPAGSWQDNILPISADVAFLFKSSVTGKSRFFIGSKFGWNRVLNRSYFDGNLMAEISVTDGLFISPYIQFQQQVTSGFGIGIEGGFRYGTSRHTIELLGQRLDNAPQTGQFYIGGQVIF
jgi:hypothetical protein